MMRTTPRDLGQFLTTPHLLLKGITFQLGTMILPIRREGVRERTLQLLYQPPLPGFQPLQQLLGAFGPVHAPVLLARPADALDEGQIDLLLEPREDEIQSLEPHGHGRVDFALGGDDVHPVGDGVGDAEVAIKVDFGFGDDGEVGGDDDGCWG